MKKKTLNGLATISLIMLLIGYSAMAFNWLPTLRNLFVIVGGLGVISFILFKET